MIIPRHAIFETLGYSLDEWVAVVDQNNLPGIDLDDFGGNWETLIRARDFLLCAGPEARESLDPRILELPTDFLSGDNEVDDVVAARIEAQTAADVAQADLLASMPTSGSFEQVFGKKGGRDTAAKLRLIRFVNYPVTSDNTATITIKLADGSHRDVIFHQDDIRATTGTPPNSIN